ncbi:MAG: hypothetical protein HYV19_03295 [Gemmatimonadetes bacterium]|nr:hypothetical protein [Gemmatimonadota bacterium]
MRSSLRRDLPFQSAVPAATAPPAAAPTAAPTTVDFVFLPSSWPAMAPTAAPAATFLAWSPVLCARTVSMLATCTLPFTGYVAPLYDTETGSNARRMPSLPFSPRLASVTRSVTRAPAGTDTPLVPVTGSLSVAFTSSPTLPVFVQKRDSLVADIAVPPAIVPVVAAAARGAGAAALGAAALGAAAAAGLAAAGAAAGWAATCAVSDSCGWPAAAGASSTCLLSAGASPDLAQAPISATAASGASVVRINFVMRISCHRVGERSLNTRFARRVAQPARRT